MQISVTVEANAKGAGELKALADLLTGKLVPVATEAAEEDAEDEAPKRRGRKPKKKEVEAETPKKRGRKKKSEEIEDEDEEDAEDVEEESDEEGEEIDEDEDAEESEDDEEDADEEDEDEEDAEEEFISPDELKKLKKALREHSDKHGKNSAVAILMKYARVSQDVKKSDLPKLLKQLKGKKAK